MSNQQWPQQPPGQSPWSQPDPRWTPQSYHEVQARDPRQPFGQQPQPGAAYGAPPGPSQPPPPGQPPYGGPPPSGQQPYGQQPDNASIENFQAPRSSIARPLLIGLAIVGAIAALLIALQFFGGDQEPTRTPTPPPPTQSNGEVQPTAAQTSGTSIPFEGNGNGTFEVLERTWTPDGLEVTFTVSLDAGQGTESFSLYVFNNQSMEVADPTDSTPISVTEGEPYEGTLTFAVQEGRTTIVLASGSGRALTALPISGP